MDLLAVYRGHPRGGNAQHGDPCGDFLASLVKSEYLVSY